MKVKEDLIAQLIERTGMDRAAVTTLVDALWDAGSLDGVTARRYLIREYFYDVAATSTMSMEQIMFDISHKYTISRTSIQRCLGIAR